MQCIYCGCTDQDACREPDGTGCRWVLTDPPVCSSCVGVTELEAQLATRAPKPPRSITRIIDGVPVEERPR